MAKDTDRFQRIYRQGVATVMEIWVDREGRPVITPVSR